MYKLESRVHENQRVLKLWRRANIFLVPTIEPRFLGSPECNFVPILTEISCPLPWWVKHSRDKPDSSSHNFPTFSKLMKYKIIIFLNPTHGLYNRTLHEDWRIETRDPQLDFR